MIALLACSAPCPPLPLVPVRWADPEEERVLRDELGELERDLALPVCLDHVALGRPVRGYGQYNPLTRGIRLLRPPEPGLLRGTLVHEVCHAVDVQNDLVSGREPAFPTADRSGFHADGRLPREAFAETCALRPYAFALLAGSCPGDPDLRGARIVADEVFAVEPRPPAARYEPVGTTDEPVDAFVEASRDAPGLPAGGVPTPVPWTLDGFVRTGEVAIAVGELELPAGPLRRFLAWSGGAWTPAEGPCPDSSTHLFVRDGEPWSVQDDGGALSYGRWAF